MVLLAAGGPALGPSLALGHTPVSRITIPVPSLASSPLQALADKRRWQLVVLDPPKLAPNRRALEKATRKYRRLNSMAMQVGGLSTRVG